MSLPPMARWEYGYKANKGSKEELLTEVFNKPQNWHSDKDLEEKCKLNQAFD